MKSFRRGERGGSGPAGMWAVPGPVLKTELIAVSDGRKCCLLCGASVCLKEPLDQGRVSFWAHGSKAESEEREGKAEGPSSEKHDMRAKLSFPNLTLCCP